MGAFASRLIRVSTSFTRPGDTTAYAAGDAVADSTSAPSVLSFSGVVDTTGHDGYVVGARVQTDQKANVAQYRLHLFHTTPTAINDNAAQTLLYADKDKRVGYIDLGPVATTTDSTNSTAAEGFDFTQRIPFVCASADSKLYAMLETRTVFTPANAQKFYVELLILTVW